MAESRFDKIKYGLLKAIDVSGFKVFDPVVRLVFREEPRKQVGDIARFLVTPIIFVVACLALWTVVAPRHKTKSGEVPTPTQVMEAGAINHTLNKRENEKEYDFAVSGEYRQNTIEEVTSLLASKAEEAEQLKKKLAEVETSVRELIVERTAPLQAQYDELKKTHRAKKDRRKVDIVALSEKVAAEQTSVEELLAAIRADAELSDQEKQAEKLIKDEIKEVGEDPRSLKQARLASNAAANEVQHLKKRLDYLKTGNRSIKVEQARQKTQAALAKLEQAKHRPPFWPQQNQL